MMNISEIRFPQFRQNHIEYAKSQEEWLAVFDKALKPIHQAGWENWLQDPFVEGTPIFSRVNRRLKKGVVINQILPSDDDIIFRAYLDIFASDSDTDLVQHVVITCVLNDKSKDKAENLIRAFLVERLSSERMNHMCEYLTGDLLPPP